MAYIMTYNMPSATKAPFYKRGPWTDLKFFIKQAGNYLFLSRKLSQKSSFYRRESNDWQC